jgi:hypothetical protein
MSMLIAAGDAGSPQKGKPRPAGRWSGKGKGDVEAAPEAGRGVHGREEVSCRKAERSAFSSTDRPRISMKPSGDLRFSRDGRPVALRDLASALPDRFQPVSRDRQNGNTQS